MDLLERFRSAGTDGTEFRGAPFWSWNDDLKPEEIRRQLREMKKAGLGGAFLHARIGLITPYMRARWMENIAAAIDECQRCELGAWLYDEDRWPSGTAGGMTAAKLGFEVASARSLRCRELSPDELEITADTVATFAAWREGGRVARVERFSGEPPPCDLVLQFTAPPVGYVDLLSPRVVRTFIELAYEPYRKRFAEHFGATVPGIFTDEPNFRCPPWSPELPEFFKQRFGYDLLDRLPELFYRLPGHEKTRHDYFAAATALYVDSFSRQIGQWCAEHNLLFTGHQLAEDSLLYQAEHIGAAMPHYVHMQMPGIDHLTRRLGTVALVKQCSSVAHQFGGRRVLSEMFGCCGWNVSLEELKWIAEYQLALGVDFICQHLSLYSMRGERKRDYPPSLHYQQPYWPEGYRLLNDYLARLIAALTWGKFQAQILLVHPIASVWAAWDPEDKSEAEELSRQFEELSRALVAIQRDFDYGDETILAEHARVEGARVVVGEMSYAVVILPRMKTISSSTLALLRQFLEAGGRVLRVGDPPPLLDGSPSNEPAQVLGPCPVCDGRPESLAEALDAMLPNAIRASATSFGRATPLCSQHRAEGEQHLFFFANSSRDQALEADITLPVEGRPYLLDPTAGEAEPLPASPSSGGVQVRLSFEPMASRLIFVNRAETPLPPEPAARPARKTILTLPNRWRLKRLDPNALTLDFCRWRVNDGPWQGPEPVILVWQTLRERKGSFDVALEFEFLSEIDGAQGQFELVCETPERFAIYINGTRVPSADVGWWRDIAFRRIPIAEHIRPGRNTIELRATLPEVPADPGPLAAEEEIYAYNLARYARELESVYIIGEFHVALAEEPEFVERRAMWARGPFTVVAPRAEADGRELTSAGLPFFAGRVELSQEIELQDLPPGRLFLELERPDAMFAAVSVNGQRAGMVAWAPWRLEVTELLVPGKNTVAIELSTSCRNLLGPHHHKDGELYGVGPGQFLAQRRDWVDSAAGEGSPWRDEYCLVRFGLAGQVRLVAEGQGN